MSKENETTTKTSDSADCIERPVSPKYQIRANLNGGFGGCKFQDWEDCWCETQEQADSEAYDLACEIYDSYDGMHGLRSIGDIIDEDEVDEAEAEEIWREEREDWLDYESRLYSSED